METRTFLSLADWLAEQLPPERAKEFREIVGERAIWDQMAYHAARFLRDELGQLRGEAKEVALKLISATDDWLGGAELDALIYRPAAKLAKDLEDAGLTDLGRTLAFDLSAASTGGEALMGLTWNLRRALTEAPTMPTDIRSRIEFLLKRLETVQRLTDSC